MQPRLGVAFLLLSPPLCLLIFPRLCFEMASSRAGFELKDSHTSYPSPPNAGITGTCCSSQKQSFQWAFTFTRLDIWWVGIYLFLETPQWYLSPPLSLSFPSFFSSLVSPLLIKDFEMLWYIAQGGLELARQDSDFQSLSLQERTTKLNCGLSFWALRYLETTFPLA